MLGLGADAVRPVRPEKYAFRRLRDSDRTPRGFCQEESQMKTPRSGTRPRTGDLFELAEAVGLFYGTKGADAAIEEFRAVVQGYRHVAKTQGQVAWLTYVLRLLLACPLLLQRPSG